MPMAFQRVDQGWQKRDQALGADAIGRHPGQVQRFLDLWPVAGNTGTFNLDMWHAWVIKDPDGVLAGVAGRGDKSLRIGTFWVSVATQILFLIQNLRHNTLPD